jgi:hypothetical protein
MSDRDKVAEIVCVTTTPKRDARIVVFRDNDTRTFRLFVWGPDGNDIQVTADFSREDASALGRALTEAAVNEWFDYD